eukprot:TRINITY_DN3832_c0_g1_i1.p2 TRINITY_DN3832_c0_g1~~TRINITY_DN3832_c0_g1_i1.p2  ORF type:complete len:187 (+),score=39.84 TRINITY_DN3832_c0_g1_i1:74-562(+)
MCIRDRVSTQSTWGFSRMLFNKGGANQSVKRPANGSLQEYIDELNAKIEEYSTVKSLLAELPLKMSHERLISFNSVAMTHVRLIHTNEVLVSLGEDYFAHQTVPQCERIIDRRVECKRCLMTLGFLVVYCCSQYRLEIATEPGQTTSRDKERNRIDKGSCGR